MDPTNILKHYRIPCKLVAAIDLTWRFTDFASATLFMIFPSIVAKVKNKGGIGQSVFQVMDDRVYDFLFSPILTLLYFVGFFLQVSSSIFLYKSCRSTSLYERAACIVWSRIAFLSVTILIVRMFLPYIILSFINITYNCARISFKILGLYFVIRHTKNIDRVFDPKLHNNIRDQSQAQVNIEFAQMENRIEQGQPVPKMEDNQLFVLPHVHRALLLVEKKSYPEAISELHIAKKYAPYDSNIELMEKTVNKMKNISEEKRKDYYCVLGVNRDTTEDAIKKAFRRASLKHHPDKHSTSPEKVKQRQAQLFHQVREAYDVLSDPLRRETYDNRLQGQDRLDGYLRSFRELYTSIKLQYKVV